MWLFIIKNIDFINERITDFIYSYISEHGNINSLFFIKVIGVTSTIYLSLYWGLKLAAIRLRENDRLRNLIDKLHVPGREIIIHICLMIMVFIIAAASGTSPVVENKKIDDNLLNK